jgi:hypothetical protein
VNTTNISVRIVGVQGEIRMRQVLNYHRSLQRKTSVHPGKNFECHERCFWFSSASKDESRDGS